jgi:hypothetical protein
VKPSPFDLANRDGLAVRWSPLPDQKRSAFPIMASAGGLERSCGELLETAWLSTGDVLDVRRHPVLSTGGDEGVELGQCLREWQRVGESEPLD